MSFANADFRLNCVDDKHSYVELDYDSKGSFCLSAKDSDLHEIALVTVSKEDAIRLANFILDRYK